MIKLNNILYNKMQLQAEEAKEQGLTKLADSVEYAINDMPITRQKLEYSFEEMNQKIHKDLWKIATTLISYYNLDSVDIDKIDKTLVSWSEKLVDDLEKTLQITDNIKSPLEYKLPGEK